MSSEITDSDACREGRADLAERGTAEESVRGRESLRPWKTPSGIKRRLTQVAKVDARDGPSKVHANAPEVITDERRIRPNGIVDGHRDVMISRREVHRDRI